MNSRLKILSINGSLKLDELIPVFFFFKLFKDQTYVKIEEGNFKLI